MSVSSCTCVVNKNQPNPQVSNLTASNTTSQLKGAVLRTNVTAQASAAIPKYPNFPSYGQYLSYIKGFASVNQPSNVGSISSGSASSSGGGSSIGE
jgi:hypothetical protein